MHAVGIDCRPGFDTMEIFFFFFYLQSEHGYLCCNKDLHMDNKPDFSVFVFHPNIFNTACRYTDKGGGEGIGSTCCNAVSTFIRRG